VEWKVGEREPGWVMRIADSCVICELDDSGLVSVEEIWEVGIAIVAPNYVLHVACILLDRRHVGPVVPVTNNAGVIAGLLWGNRANRITDNVVGVYKGGGGMWATEMLYMYFVSVMWNNETSGQSWNDAETMVMGQFWKVKGNYGFCAGFGMFTKKRWLIWLRGLSGLSITE